LILFIIYRNIIPIQLQQYRAKRLEEVLDKKLKDEEAVAE